MGKFRYLDVPRQWTETFTKYPHGLTIFEALVSWTNQVNKMVDNINNLNNYMDDFINQWQGEMKKEVKETLELWESTGILDDIISSVLDGRLTDIDSKVENLISLSNEPLPVASLQHLFTHSVETGVGTSQVKQGWLQGFCVVGNNIVLARISSYQLTDDVVLTEVDMTTKKVVREVVLPLGHANDLEYIPETNEILCAPMQRVINGKREPVYELIVIDYTNLFIKRIIQLPSLATGVARDPITNELAYKNAFTVSYMDSDYSVIRVVECEQTIPGDVGQGLCLYNGKIYMPRSLPETIQVWDRMGKHEQTYHLPTYTDAGRFIGEVESMKPLGNFSFIIGTVAARDSKHKISDFDFYKLDFKKSISTTPNYKGTQRHNVSRKTFYVNSTYDGKDADGTMNKPFPDIQLAVNLCNDSSFEYVIIVEQGDYGYVEIFKPNACITITGTSNSTRANVKGININKVNHVALLYLNIGPIEGDNKSVFVQNGAQVNIYDCDIVGTASVSGLSINRSLVRINNVLINNVDNGMYVNNGSIVTIWGSTISGVNGKDVFVNNMSEVKLSANTTLNVENIQKSNGGKIMYGDNWL